MNMSRTYTVTEYTNQDIKELEYMDFETVLQQLDRIKCGYLPSGWRYPSANPERVFTAKGYDATVLRQSINIAMALVREKMEQEHARQFHVPIKPLYTGEIYAQPVRANKEQYYLMRVTKWTDHSRDAQEETHKCFYFHSNIRNAVMEKLRSEEWCKTLFQYDSDEHFKKLPTSLR